MGVGVLLMGGEVAPADAAARTNAPAIKRIAEGVFELGGVRLDKASRSVSFPAVLNMNAGAVEYVLVGSTGKIHESLLRTEVEPVHVHAAMLLLGLQDRTPRMVPGQVPPAPGGDEVLITFEWVEAGKTLKRRAEECIRNTQTGRIMARGPWIYNGSRLVETQFMAQSTRSFVAVMEDVDALVNNPRPGHENDKIWIVEEKAVPPPGMPVVVRMEWRPPGTKAP
jgi:hypothetical protein